MIKQLKQRAIKEFERYILTINADKFRKVKCYTCGKILSMSRAGVGYLTGKSNSVLFDETLAEPQCKECLKSKEAKTIFLYKKLQENNQIEILVEILDKMNQRFKLKRFTEEELKEIIKEYKGLIILESKKFKKMTKKSKEQSIAELREFVIKRGLGDVPTRYKEIFSYRIGLDDGTLKTLEETGKKFEITRERVRQIEEKVWEIIRGRN